MKKQWNRSAKVAAILYGAIFLLMLVCNILSIYIMDDFKYQFSFADDTRITSIGQIIPSMIGHAYDMNGRLVAHAWVQLFALTPLWVFDIVNAAVFVLQIALICRICRGDGERKNILIPIVFCLFWLFEPVFAQANLWQDGACNYLWSIVFCLLFLIPVIEDFLLEKKIRSLWGKGGFLVLAFMAGAYSETLSAAAIFMAGLFVLLMVIYQKRKWPVFWIAAIAVAFAGYISIYLAPAQWMEKAAEMHPRILLDNMVVAMDMYVDKFGLLICAFVVMLMIGIYEKVELKRLMLSGVFVLGSLAANFIMIFASYYGPRSAIGAFALLAVADAILVYALLENMKYRVLVTSAVALLLLATIPAGLAGMVDILETYVQLRNNEAYIYECKENGILDVQLPLIESSTPYSIAHGRKYLDEDPNVWPNYSMAMYYGVDTISIEDD